MARSWSNRHDARPLFGKDEFGSQECRKNRGDSVLFPSSFLVDGTSDEEAVAHAPAVIQKWSDTARTLGRPIPEPRGKLAYA
jgi:hypothetical protein